MITVTFQGQYMQKYLKIDHKAPPARHSIVDHRFSRDGINELREKFMAQFNESTQTDSEIFQIMSTDVTCEDELKLILRLMAERQFLQRVGVQDDPPKCPCGSGMLVCTVNGYLFCVADSGVLREKPCNLVDGMRLNDGGNSVIDIPRTMADCCKAHSETDCTGELRFWTSNSPPCDVPLLPETSGVLWAECKSCSWLSAA